ncbi:hypothetical protein COE67_18885 [Priestia megaterium]|uniref:family 10 glycosylhydrolase n=1 Tax=Priestia TaxID=2800373 RepID=UPI0009906C10|nr:family 10 glycosylhydrolase [Priestia megaterium]AQU76805.1 hypothetical protein BUW91_26675 [Priestia megaterium]MDH6656983.1 uncharacterized lipoprotein YddW (UPF0748 family) [Bacillus sp. PvP124]PFP04289.1 hypothetical protein COJ90_29015 [Priestia megaterium]PGX37091.1 hypothetical protein COE67_18885 [Priestia megaterium]
MYKKIGGSILASTLIISSVTIADSAKAESSNEIVKVLTIEDGSGEKLAVNAVNQQDNNNKLVLFNDKFSYYTETKKGSKEVILEKIGLNTYKVLEKADGDSPIPEEGLVLSTGSQSTDTIQGFLSQLEKDETVKLMEPVEIKEEMVAQAINPTKESNPDGAPFDGFRGPDQLIVYTPTFGDTTKTNSYGYEITVEDGFVTKVGGGGSKIPKNGFVVSGHGVAASWLSSNSIIGAKVTVGSSGVVKITQDVESFAFQSKQAINQAKESIEKAQKEYLDVEMSKAQDSLLKAENLLEQVKVLKESDPVKALDVTRQATQAAYDAYYYSIPSNLAEQRAIWYRPEETTLAGVRQILDRMQKAGFNSVYLETTFHGYTIYPSKIMKKYGLPEQHPNFKNANYEKYGNDLLQAYVQEGKKRGLSIQAWTDGFMVGESSLGMPSQFKKYPEWAAVQRQNSSNKVMPDSLSKYYWMDIAQPDVQTFLLAIYKEMQANYNIKGLNIDYMRYPHHKFEESYGFSENIRSAYKKQFKIDPYDIKPSDDPQEWERWEAWLRKRENDFVDQLHAQSKELNPKFMMTATPEPGPEAGLISDWKEDIDGVIPQAYGHDFNSIQKTVQDSKKLMPKGSMYYTGIYSFYHHLDEMANVNDVASAKHGTSGVNMFAFGQASAPAVDALGKGPWRNKAVNPGEEPLLATENVLKEMGNKLIPDYIRQGAVEKRKGKELQKIVKKLRRTIQKKPSESNKDFELLLEQIDISAKQNKLNNDVANRMKEHLQEANEWVNYALTKQK